MKGIVAEINGRYAVVLGQDGCFVKVRNSGKFRVGSEIETDQPRRFTFHMPLPPRIPAIARVSSIAAAFILTLGISFGAYAYHTPYSYVGVDINPSVELSVNIFDRIIDVEALNKDGQALIDPASLKNLDVGEGVRKLLDAAQEKGYLKPGDENTVILSVSSQNEKKSEELEKNLKQDASIEIDEVKTNADIVTEKANREEHDKARTIGVTPGKLSLMEKVIEAEPEIKLDDLKGASVKDIMKQLKDIKKAKKDKISKQNGTEDSKQPDELAGGSDNGSDQNAVSPGNGNGKGKDDKHGSNGKGKASKYKKQTGGGSDGSGNDEQENGKDSYGSQKNGGLNKNTDNASNDAQNSDKDDKKDNGNSKNGNKKNDD